MSGDRMPVAALTQKLGDSDFHRAVVAMMPGGPMSSAPAVRPCGTGPWRRH